MSRLDEIRERHAARLRTRAAKGDGSVQMSTLVDDDMAWLLAEVERMEELGHQAITAEARAVADLEAEVAKAWQRAADRRNEARRYYVAWQNARMRAQDYGSGLSQAEVRAQGSP